MFGFINVNKPAGPTSHDIVARVRKLVPRGVKVGHTGTLDPFADGVLVLCLGPATRLAEYVQAQLKYYKAQITLAATSTTDDSEGQVTQLQDAAAVDEARIRDILVQFTGEIQQIPPAHSAVHVDGQRAYKLARKGEQLELPARSVTIHSLEFLYYEFPLLEIDVSCSSGTYIRSLARDIGSAAGVGGYCSRLTRTAVGDFRLSDSVEIEQISLPRDLLSPLLAVESLTKITVDEQSAQRIANGNRINIEEPQPPCSTLALLNEQGALIAIAAVDDIGKTLQPKKVFPCYK